MIKSISRDTENTVTTMTDFRNSHRKCSVRKGVLRNSEKFTGRNLCQSLFFNKVAGLRPQFVCMEQLLLRTSRPDVFYKKAVLKNFAKFTGKRLCQSLFFNKIAGLVLESLFHKVAEGLLLASLVI